MKNNQGVLFGVIFLSGSALGYLVGSNKDQASAESDSSPTAKPSSQNVASSTSSIHSRLNRSTGNGRNDNASKSNADPRQLILQADGSFIVPKDAAYRINANPCNYEGELLLDECKKIGLSEIQFQNLLELQNQHLAREKKRQADEATILCEQEHFRAFYVPPNTQLKNWGQEYSEQASLILADHVSMTLPELSQALGYTNDPTKNEHIIVMEEDESGKRNYSIFEYGKPIDVDMFRNAQTANDFRKDAQRIRKTTSPQIPEKLQHIIKE